LGIIVLTSADPG